MILNSKILSTAILLLYHLTATCQWESSINDHCSRAELRGNSKSRQSSFVDVSIDGTVPNLERIKIATVVTQDINVTKALYGEWLGYRIVEDGMIPKPLANSWGTPEMDGKPYALLQGESGDDVYLRVIQGTLPKGYKAMTTNGWNAIEMIVENPDAIYEKLIDSPFVNLGAPANLGADGISTIRAVQFKGPSEEVFYFTTDTGDRSTSNLLTPRAALLLWWWPDQAPVPLLIFMCLILGLRNPFLLRPLSILFLWRKTCQQNICFHLAL